jgi:hypothetical protein
MSENKKSIELNQNDEEVWSRVVRCHLDFALASEEFLYGDIDRVSIIKKALRGKDRNTALFFLKWLSISELQQAFEELIYLSSSEHGGINVVHEAILSIPKEWLLNNITKMTEPYLQNGTGEEYRRFLELYFMIDIALAKDLANRASINDDYDIKEAGQEFLEKIEFLKQ